MYYNLGILFMEDKDPMVLKNLIQYITDAFKLRESELVMPK